MCYISKLRVHTYDMYIYINKLYIPTFLKLKILNPFSRTYIYRCARFTWSKNSLLIKIRRKKRSSFSNILHVLMHVCLMEHCWTFTYYTQQQQRRINARKYLYSITTFLAILCACVVADALRDAEFFASLHCGGHPGIGCFFGGSASTTTSTV